MTDLFLEAPLTVVIMIMLHVTMMAKGRMVPKTSWNVEATWLPITSPGTFRIRFSMPGKTKFRSFQIIVIQSICVAALQLVFGRR
jgi:hypothetical protein